MKQQAVLILDGDMYLHRCLHIQKLREFKTIDGTRTGILYGVLNSIFRLIDTLRDFDIKGVYFLLSTGTSFRVNIDEKYKYREPKENDEWSMHDPQLGYSKGEFYKTQKELVKEILPVFGIKVMWEYTYEADDLAAFLVRMNLFNKRKILVADDYDWCQLVSEDVDLYRATKEEYVTHENFEEVLGIKSPIHHCLYLSILGGHDNIPGVLPGFGDVGARKMLAELKEPTLEAILEWADQQKKKGRGFLEEEVQLRLKKNLELVDLSKVEFDSNFRMKMKQIVLGNLEYNSSLIVSVLKRYEFASFANLIDSLKLKNLF